MTNKLGGRFISGGDVRQIIRGSAARQNPELLEQIRQRFNFDYKNPPITLGYDTFLAIAEFLRQKLYPNLKNDEALEKLGYDMVQSYMDKPIGKVNRIAAKMSGPEATTDLIVNSMSSIISFGRYVVEEVRPGFARFHMYNLPGQPALVGGIIKASMELAQVREIKIKASSVATDEAIYEVTWNKG